MPVFATPEPISATIELVVGDARITATDRDDTVVDVRPSDASADIDVRAAAETRIEYADGHLLVRAPKQRGFGLLGKAGSVDVTIALPTGSHLHGVAAVAAFHGVGRLGACRIKTATGDIHLEGADTLDLNTAGGAIDVDHVAGHADVRTGTGRIRIADIGGPAVIKNSNGDTWIGAAAAELRINAANGDIAVDHPNAGVTAASSNGDIRIGDARRGAVSIRTACGELEIGIRSGAAALLDVKTQYGSVRNRLEACEAPEQSDDTVEVRARSSYGDIVINRS
jgi:hypothetical protein